MFIRKDDLKPFDKKIWLASPTMHGEELKYVTEAYETNWMSTVGTNINEVERIAAEKAGVKYAVALAACTPALHLCVKLAGEKLYGKPAISHGALEGKRVFCSDMTFDATLNERDENGELLPDIKRLTPFGRKLRATSVDELPELINIFKGEMSIVGPRPLAVVYLPYYTEEEMHRHDVRPGLTGLARKNKKRSGMFAFSGAFHGMSLGSLALTTDRVSREGASVPLNNVTFIPYDGTFDSIEYLKWVLSDDHSGIDKPAGIILETIQAEGGINIASVEWLKAIRKICDEYDILMIVDDIQVGNGRAGYFFSFERANIVPDMVVLSKSISGFGMPMALVLVKPELDIFRPAEHNGTFRGNQLSFVGGTAAINYFINNDLGSEVRRKGLIVERFLNDEIIPLDCRLKYRGMGLIWGIDFNEIDSKKAIEAVHVAFDNKLVLEVAGRGDGVLKIMPPLTIEDEVLLEGLQIVKKAVYEVLK